MTRDDSQSCLAFSEEHCWHSSLLSHALLGTIQSELSTTLKLWPRPSFTPIQLQVYILELLHSHFIKLQPRLYSKRNRRRGDSKRNQWRHVKIITNIAYCLFVPSIKRYSHNRIASKYHYHASAYSLQIVAILFTQRKRKR